MSRAADDLVAVGCLQERPSCLTTSVGQKLENKTFFQTVSLWLERSRQRSELRELIESPDDTFKDIGISRYDVQREERKPFWRQ